MEFGVVRCTVFNNAVVTSHQVFLTREVLADIAATTLENLRQWRKSRRGAELPNALRMP